MIGAGGGAPGGTVPVKRTDVATILALTGEKLGGKDTVADYLVSHYGAFHVRHSQILDDILRTLDVPISRRNEIDLGMALRKVFGDGVLGRALRHRVLAAEGSSDLTVINGVRFQDELENARGLRAAVVYVTAPEDLRYQRFLRRNEKADDRGQTLEQFRAQEQEPTEIGIPALGAQADFRIDNIGSLEELYRAVDRVLAQVRERS